MSKTIHSDVVIIGAGLVGLTAAIAFAQKKRSVVLIDAQKPSKTKLAVWDSRVYALTERSIDWLQRLGVWTVVEHERVNTIQAMQLWGPNDEQPLSLRAADAYLTAMGCVLESQNLVHACWQLIDTLDVTVMSEVSCQSLLHTTEQIDLHLSDGSQVSAKLLLGADGGSSWVKQQMQMGESFKAFNQTAIVANYESALPHGDVARQWFDAHETLALLPLPHQIVSMVWSLPTAEAHMLLKQSKKDLAERVEHRVGSILGVLTPLNDAVPFVLNQKTAAKLVSDRVALIGDAAHQVHPMAGQGVNLGFGDVMKLVELTTNLNALQDIGDYTLLRQYERARKLDILEMNQLTTGLDTLFSFKDKLMPKYVNWGMQLVGQHNAIKKRLIRHATL